VNQNGGFEKDFQAPMVRLSRKLSRTTAVTGVKFSSDKSLDKEVVAKSKERLYKALWVH
jgi:hypothetical protein